MPLDEELFSPRGRSASASGSALAPRLGDLEGVPIGILSNRKQNAATFLGFVAQLLQEREGAGEVTLWEKDGASVPAPEPLLAEMKARSRLILTGIGD